MSRRNGKKPSSHDVGYDIMMMVLLTVLLVVCILQRASFAHCFMVVSAMIIYIAYIVFAYDWFKKK